MRKQTGVCGNVKEFDKFLGATKVGPFYFLSDLENIEVYVKSSAVIEWQYQNAS